MSRPFRLMAQEWGEDLPDCILFDVLHSPQFQSLFEDAIDFERWEMNSDWVIPSQEEPCKSLIWTRYAEVTIDALVNR